MQTSAEIVVIGAGIVGTSAAYFLAQKNWKNIVVVDQGPLFETGGSTSHAPGLAFQLNPSKTICQLAQWSVGTYRKLCWNDQPCFYQSGSLEIAYSPERWQDLKIKWGRALAWGLQAELLNRDQVLNKMPLLNPTQIYGALSIPSDGIAKAGRIVESLSHEARKLGVSFHGNTKVTGIESSQKRIKKVLTSKGSIQTSRVLVCAGIWGPEIGKMAGISISLAPVQHQYVRTAPLKEIAGETREVVFPILRNQDHGLYFRQHFDSIGIGSYAHTPLLIEPRDVGESAIRPFTPEHFFKPYLNASHLIPALEGADLVEKFNGMFSFTPDGNPLVGQAPELKGFWMAEGVWVTHGAGVGRIAAELISDEIPEIDLRELDLNRFANHVSSPAYVRTRGAQQYREIYDIIHPLQQIGKPRPLRVSPFYHRQKELGAVFFESNGWERPQWFEKNSTLPHRALHEENWPKRSGWNARFWSPIIGQEHRATREGVTLFDLSAFSKFEVSGKGTLGFLQKISTNQIDQPIGKIIYTPMLNSKGGIMCDLTITRRDTERFWIVTGGAVGMHDRGWMLEQLAQLSDSNSLNDGPIQLIDRTSQYCCLGIWGPKARNLLQSLSEDDLSNRAFPFYTSKSIYIGDAPVFAMRLSYVGELGWEIYTSTEYGLYLWDILWIAGQQFGIAAAGGGAFDSLRLEKGYRLWGADIHSEYNPHEAGLGFTLKLNKGDFIGKTALEGQTALARKLCCMIVEDQNIIFMGKEPILSGEKVLGYVTSANYGYSVNQSIFYGYLPIEYSQPGTPIEVLYLGEGHRGRVVQEPLFDPLHTRLKA